MTTNQNPLAIVSNTLTANREKLRIALGELMTPEKYVSLTLDAFRKNPKLLQTTPASQWNSIVSAANAGLKIGGVEGQAYLVPYGDECQLQVSYKGLMKLARDAGCRRIDAKVVREGDHFKEPVDLVNPVLEFQPSRDPKRHTRPITHVFCIYILSTGEPVWHVMTKDEVDVHAEKFSRSYMDKNGPWQQHWEAMALKTVLRWPINRGFVPLTPIAQQVVELDDVYDSTAREVEPVPLEQLTQQTPAEDPLDEQVMRMLQDAETVADCDAICNTFLKDWAVDHHDEINQLCEARKADLRAKQNRPYEEPQMVDENGNPV